MPTYYAICPSYSIFIFSSLFAVFWTEYICNFFALFLLAYYFYNFYIVLLVIMEVTRGVFVLIKVQCKLVLLSLCGKLENLRMNAFTTYVLLLNYMLFLGI